MKVAILNMKIKEETTKVIFDTFKLYFKTFI